MSHIKFFERGLGKIFFEGKGFPMKPRKQKSPMTNRYLRFQPKKFIGRTLLFSLSLLASGIVILLMVTPLISSVSLFCFKILAWGLILAAFAFLFRFGMVSYEYCVSDRYFRVERILFGKRQLVFDLDIRYICDIKIPCKGPKKHPFPHPLRYHNHTASWPARETAVIYYHTTAAQIHALIVDYQESFFSQLGAELLRNGIIVSENTEA